MRKNLCLLSVIAVALAGTPLRAADPPSLDGIYALSAYAGRFRLLTIDGTKFEIRQGDDAIHGKMFPIANPFSGPSDGRNIQFTYFNGERELTLRETYAVIDGHLWIGVFYHGISQEKEDRWISQSQAAGLLGQGDAPTEEFVWEPKPGNMTYGSNHRNTITAITAPLPADQKGERLAALFPMKVDVQNFPPRDHLVVDNTGDSQMILSSIGAFVTGSVTPEQIFKKADAVTHGQFGFIRRDDVLLAPWSLDLGPVGLKAVKMDAAKLPATARNAAGTVATLTTAKPATNIQMGRMSAEQIKAATSTLVFDPDAAGLSIRPWGWDCMMNHADVPGTIIWFLTADHKIVRIVYPAACDIVGAAARITTDIFEIDNGK